MTNVYNQTLFERNSIQDVPSGYIDDAANNLFMFMGSFWKNIHRGNALVKGIQKVRGIKVAQFYLDLIETLKLQDRRGAPVYHRELWRPLVIRKSRRNEAQENLLKVGGDAVIGEQPSGSKYGKGTVLNIGSLANLENYVTYPIEDDIETVGTCITDNVINPTVSYNISYDFPSDDVIYTNGTLIFPIDKDPFGDNSPFDIYDTVDDGSDENDQETVLWASDVLIDKDYIAYHMAYALGINCESTYITKRIINAGWDVLNCGMTPELLRMLLAAMLNIPVVQEDTETIRRITTLSDGNRKITTDKHVYIVYKSANLRTCIKVGKDVHRGDFLDESVKVYPQLTDVSDAKLDGITEYAKILKEDIPVITLPDTFIRTRTARGIAVDWTPTDVIDTGDIDANGHRKLFFEVGGSEEDVDAFWEDVWDAAEQDNVNLEDYFIQCGTDSSSSSDDTWKIVPAKFFLMNMIGANTLIVTLDRTQLEDVSNVHNPMYFNLINQAIPSGMRLFMIEHVLIDDETDDYRLEEDQTYDEVDKYVLEDVDDEIDFNDLPGMKGKRIPTYEDQIEMKLFRNRKRTAE